MRFILTHEELREIEKKRKIVLNTPNQDTVIWRYYSLEKFLGLLTTQNIFFTSAIKFDDPFEGDYGGRAKAYIRNKYGKDQYQRDYNTYEFLRAHTYISCWYESEHESDAMWKLYGKGIAIKTTFGAISRLVLWLETEIRQAGRINYVDYNVDPVSVGNSWISYFYKRKSFAHEREVRFLLQEYRTNWKIYPEPQAGKVIPLDFNNNIDEIVFSPFMEEFVCDSIKKIINKFGISVPIRKSTLLDKPIW